MSDVARVAEAIREAWISTDGLIKDDKLTAMAEAAIQVVRADLAVLFEQAAAGRREYAVNAPAASAEVLEQQASDLDTAAQLARGDMTAMTAWLPSWRWTDEMTADL